MPDPIPGRSRLLRAEPVFVDAGGNRSDAELYAAMLDGNFAADALFAADLIALEVAGGMPRQDAEALYTPR